MFGIGGRRKAPEAVAQVPELADLDAADDMAEADVDWRADGPFDFDEVELGDEQRLDLGTLIVTGFPGMQIQLAQDAAGKAQSVLAVWNESALECTLFAEEVSIGAGESVKGRLDTLAAEAVAAGGEASWEEDQGPFGPLLQIVVPVRAKGKSLVQVSRVWAVNGPRWLLQGRLFGELATCPPDDPKVGVFIELFRNLVVRRGADPLPPGEPIALSIPQGGSDGEA
ncbi:MAG: DUF3710 domain-containing protein [Propionibacteriaceae bacterium]|jgi:hypothetical protein|nr:DUF3710 domain-containing protein [Propionibacteriaceae bacterium]